MLILENKLHVLGNNPKYGTPWCETDFKFFIHEFCFIKQQTPSVPYLHTDEMEVRTEIRLCVVNCEITAYMP